MDEKSLQDELKSLNEQAHRLAVDELDGIGDPKERLQQARALNERLISLKVNVDAVAESRRVKLEGLYGSADRDLFFVISEGESRIKATPRPEQEELIDLARRINGQAFTIAKAMTGKSPDRASLTAVAGLLDDQIKGLVDKPGYSAPEVQRLMSEAVQDIRFVRMGGKGPMSLRLHHFLQEGNQAL